MPFPFRHLSLDERRRLLEDHADLGKRRATAAGYDAGRLSPEVR